MMIKIAVAAAIGARFRKSALVDSATAHPDMKNAWDSVRAAQIS
jgi:hypothetical protein